MSIVVAAKSGREIYMGAKSLCGNTLMNPMTAPKVYLKQSTQYEGSKIYPRYQMLIGAVGTTKFYAPLYYDFVPPPFRYLARPEYIERYLFKDVIPVLQQLFEENGLSHRESGRAIFEGAVLFACGGRIFTISDDWGIDESTFNYEAIGAGRAVALGSLFSTTRSKKGQNRVATALRACERFVPGIGQPFTILRISDDPF